MPQRYSIAEARNQLARLVCDAEMGTPIEITRRGRPVAMVISLEQYRCIAASLPLWEAYTSFRERHSDAGVEPEEWLADARDRSIGREHAW